MKNYRRNIPLLLTGVALLTALVLTAWHYFRGQDPRYEVLSAETRLKSIDSELKSSTEKLCKKYAAEAFHQDFLHSTAIERGISFYLYENGSLVAWTDNGPALPFLSIDTLRDGAVIRLKNGHYWIRTSRSNTRLAVGLALIHLDYPYENKYLQNRFNPYLDLPVESEFGNDGIEFHTPDGKAIGRINTLAQEPPCWILAGWWLVIGLLSIGFFLHLSKRTLSGRNRWSLVFLLLGLRLYMMYFQFPEALYVSGMFSPAVYAANAIFNSPGDLFLNGLTLLLLVILVINTSAPTGSAIVRRLSVIISAVVFASGLQALTRGLVMDASVSLDITDLSGIDSYTVVLLSSLFLYILAGALFINWISGKKIEDISFGRSMLALLVVSAFASVLLFRFLHQRDLDNRSRLAKKVTNERDPVAEYLFKEEYVCIRTDTALSGILTDKGSEAEVQSRIRTHHMKEYFGRFDWTLSLYDSSGRSTSDDALMTIDSLRTELNAYATATASPGFFALPAQAGRMRYCAVIPMAVNGHDSMATIVLQMRSSFLYTATGFPELLISGTVLNNRISEKYSFAQYEEGTLVYEFGEFPYSLYPDQFLIEHDVAPCSVVADGFDHLVLQEGGGRITVISRPSAGYLSFITLFSWLFAFFGTLSLLIVQTRSLLINTSSGFSLTRRVRTSVISLVVLAFLATGAVTVFYILRKYDNDQRRNIGEQLSGLWVLLGDRLGLGTPFSELKPGWLSDELGQIVSSTNIDFNLFDEKGRLFFSSQPRLHEQAIVSDRMDPEAFHELNEFGKTQFIHRESVGSLEHLAAYAPFVGPDGKTTGYLHLPYFEKQYERSREVSGFLSTLFNIYILLLAVAVFVAAFISSRVTRPLALIQERLSAMRFGSRNEPIVYTVNDEIGQLVQEYNRMLQELADSADKLARSERESAWREMAKQVAHEIKNPLTPMRLSIQQLQRVWSEQSENREELTRHMAKVLLEQIDTLSHIATEFSNFAKMPAAIPSPVDIREIITSSISLFSHSYPHEFRFNSPLQPFILSADKDQLQRIFSNLLKNAVQAIPDGRKGIIEVRLMREEGGFIRIDVEDNGKGISVSDRSRIFVPNFTTKSSGTGLGLAMVKNIVEQGGGSVSFESTEGKGTVFTIRWPEAKGIV